MKFCRTCHKSTGTGISFCDNQCENNFKKNQFDLESIEPVATWEDYGSQYPTFKEFASKKKNMIELDGQKYPKESELYDSLPSFEEMQTKSLLKK